MTLSFFPAFNPGAEVSPKVRAAAQGALQQHDHLWATVVARTIALSPIEQHKLVNHGVSTSVLADLVKSYAALNEAEILSAVGISSRTIQRRKDAVLSSEHSGAALDLIEVTQRAMDVLGSRQIAEEWLHRPALAFDGRKPIELLSTRQGADLVKDHLTRMDYGVYA
ncbi:MAG: DUF2384 domain-containing protein [Hydrogenophaga sp.]|nr:DUF2384 domain-containing protein [Hydrogenophaga sp.]